MKRKVLLLCVAVVLLSLLSAGTYAYYTVTGTATNVITTGGIQFSVLHSSNDVTISSNEPLVIMPGDVVSREVTVRNDGDHPMYLRLKLTPGVNDETLTAQGCMSLNINTADWTYLDGYYYYNTALPAGQTTAPIFTEVTFVGDRIGNEYLGKLFSLDVAAYAVQSENNGTDPLEAAGWPEN